MSRTRQAAGGGRAVEVDPARLAGWFERFAARNDGVATTSFGAGEVVVSAHNGTTATARVPFPPLPGGVEGVREGLAVGALVEQANRPRRIGLLLVRLGGHSLGIAEHGSVLLSRTDRHHVHGRSAAGGWSQQRFARRREGQARQALRAAAEDAVEVLLPRLPEVDAIVLGGDRRALDELRADRRLAPLFAAAASPVLDIGEPRRTVLEEAARRAIAVEIVVREGVRPATGP
jgi:peptide subunit release factor 1 (eRF1)